MKRRRAVGPAVRLATALVVLVAAPRAYAETESAPMTAETLSGVTLGASGGVTTFAADAGSRISADPAMSLHVYGGYRFRNGLSPELELFHTTSVSSLGPGLRWWIPIDGHVRPWIGSHVGVDHVTLESGDTSSGMTYWSVDAGAGIDFMLTRSLALGIGGDWTYANALSPPRAQPIPAGSAAAPRDSYVLDWITIRAGIGIVL